MRYVALALAVAMTFGAGIGLVSVGTAQAHGGAGFAQEQSNAATLGCGDLPTANTEAAACVYQTGGNK